MKIRTLLASTAVLTLVAGIAVAGEFKASCPVSGGPAKESNFVEFEGAKVYFCCKGCPKKFQANTKKFAAKAHYQMLQTGQAVQVACPMSGKKLNPEMTADLVGQKVGFCCAGCKKKFAAAEDKVACVLSPAAFAKGFTTQTTCPVGGKPIKANIFTEHNGKKVYFCCKGCIAKFKANPEKYAKK